LEFQGVSFMLADAVTQLEAARLLNASTDEIAIVESTTAGLNSIAAAMPFEDGDNILFFRRL
jgi:selenocysteine lyase/cysteine desulfurase